jgi:hypothetical protein
MARIWTLSFRSYDILLELQTRVPREFEPCWIQEPLMLTDALGRVAPVHLELINTWAVLESVLEARFHNIPGERKIKRREYALQERSSQRDIQRSASFNSSFLPGSKVDMSMVFKQGHTGAHCPGCGKECQQAATTNSKWSETPGNNAFQSADGILVKVVAYGSRGLRSFWNTISRSQSVNQLQLSRSRSPGCPPKLCPDPTAWELQRPNLILQSGRPILLILTSRCHFSSEYGYSSQNTSIPREQEPAQNKVSGFHHAHS